MKRGRQILMWMMLIGLLGGCGANGETSGQENSTEPQAVTESSAGNSVDAEGAHEGTSSMDAENVHGDNSSTNAENVQESNSKVTEDAKNEELEEGEEMNPAQYFERMILTESYKKTGQANPLMTQRFGADPYAMVYGDRVYFYMTADAFEYDADGNVVENTYGKIRSINVISTEDMVNFKDHGSIAAAGKEGAATWANNSWAPAAAWKEIDGEVKFFLYFANSGGGIGVLTSDSPTGPFVDPLGEALVSKSTPNCSDVLWLFDPAVLVDDDGRAYLYFGGGVPEGKVADPGTARVVELGEDMISIKGEPQKIDVPYLFEDSGIHKYGEKYYYTYCSNWQVDAEGTAQYGFRSAEIVSMESDSPMGPFMVKERILENPGRYFGLYGNNHHCVFEFKGNWYITYHARTLEKAMGIEKGYRSTHIDSFEMGEDGTIGTISQTLAGRKQLQYVDAYVENPAVMMAVQGGLTTVPMADERGAQMVLADIDRGDFVKVQGVDFGEKAPTKWNTYIRKSEYCGEDCVIQLRVGTATGQVIGYLTLTEAVETGDDGFDRYEAVLTQEVTGVNDFYMIFSGCDYQVKSWYFE